MQPLENSTVLANLDTKYHILHNCNIWIYGKKVILVKANMNI